jgi:hypothetical protein
MISTTQVKKRDSVPPYGEVRVRHLATRNGKPIDLQEALSPRVREALIAQGIKPELLGKNLVVNSGRSQLARLIRRVTNGAWINRVQLGDCKIAGVVRKSDFPPDLSDTSLIHEIRNLGGQPGATFDIDEDSSPDEVVKVDASVGTPGVLTAGVTSILADNTGADYIAAGITDRDTVTIILNGEDFTLGVNEVIDSTTLEVSNPGQLAGAVGYTVQTPGTQALFRKLISGDNFPESEFGPATVVHEAGLIFTDSTLFNRITFQQNDDSIGLVLQPTDIDGTRIDVQLDWLITF